MKFFFENFKFVAFLILGGLTQVNSEFVLMILFMFITMLIVLFAFDSITNYYNNERFLMYKDLLVNYFFVVETLKKN